MDRYMITASGQRVDLPEPLPTQIKVEDIAVHLSRINRFVGAAAPYSVAQHSVAVACMAVAVASLGGGSPSPSPLIREGLMHDAPEYLTGDIPSPVKAYFRVAYNKVAQPIDRAIRLRFDLAATEPQDVWLADKILLQIEQKRLPARLDLQYVPVAALTAMEKLQGNEWYLLAERRASLTMTHDEAASLFLDWWDNSNNMSI